MEIKQYSWGIVDSNSWLIIEDNHGLLIDAVDNELLYDSCKKLSDLTVIITHAHFDHIIGLNSIRNIVKNVIVISTVKCSDYIGDVHRNMSAVATVYLQFYKNGQKKKVEIDPFLCNPSSIVFSDNYQLKWNGHNVCLLAVHGHSDDGLIAVLDEKYLFSGDTLLPVPTITRFPTGSKKEFINKDIPLLEKLKSIETVFPGHGNKADLARMLALNNVI